MLGFPVRSFPKWILEGGLDNQTFQTWRFFIFFKLPLAEWLMCVLWNTPSGCVPCIFIPKAAYLLVLWLVIKSLNYRGLDPLMSKGQSTTIFSRNEYLAHLWWGIPSYKSQWHLEHSSWQTWSRTALKRLPSTPPRLLGWCWRRWLVSEWPLAIGWLANVDFSWAIHPVQEGSCKV